MNNNIQRILSNNVKTRITCPEPNCNEDYLGEIGRIIIERTTDHCRKDEQSHLLKHALISNHPVTDLKDLKVIEKNYHGNKYKRNI